MQKVLTVILLMLSSMAFCATQSPATSLKITPQLTQDYPPPWPPTGNRCMAFNTDGMILCCSVNCSYDKSAVCVNGDRMTTCENASCTCE